MARPRVSIVVSTFNARPEKLEVVERLFLPSALRQGGPDRQLVLLDDASPLREETRRLLDRFRPQLAAAFGDLQIVENAENLGFAKSYNRGLERADGDVRLVVNDDVYLPRGSVSALAETLRAGDRAGAVAPVTNLASGFQSTRLFAPLRDFSDAELERIEAFAAWLRRTMQGRRYPDPRGLIGFCLAFDAAALREVGAFDPRFRFALFEDTDLLRRIRASGRRTVLDAATFVEHGGPSGWSISLSQRPGRLLAAVAANGWRYARKWNAWWEVPVGLVRGQVQDLLDVGTVTREIVDTARERGTWDAYRALSHGARSRSGSSNA